MIAPLTLGWFLDHGWAEGTLYGVAVAFAATVLAIRIVDSFARSGYAGVARASP
jgi:predicted Kef-type K+ transport protein